MRSTRLARGDQRRHAQFRARRPVVAVVVVGAHATHALHAHDVLDAARQRALAGGAVARESQEHGTHPATVPQATPGGTLGIHLDARGTDGRPHPALERFRRADRGGQHPRHHRGGLGPSHLVDVVRPPALRPVREPSAHGHRDPRLRRQRPVRDVEGPRRAGALRGLEGASAPSTTRCCCRCAGSARRSRGTPRPCPSCRGSTSPAGPSARDCPWASAWRWPCGWTARPRARGCSWATPRWRRARVWEAFEAATYHEVDNLIALLDLNRLGQRGPTMHEWHADVFARRAQAYGWHTIEIDGHDVGVDRSRVLGGRGRRTSHPDRGAHAEGPRRLVPGRQGGLARQGGAGGPGGAAIAELGGPRSLRITPPRPEAFKEVALRRAASCRRPPPTPRPSPRARRSARRSRGWRAIAPTSWCWTARWATPPTPRTSRRWRPSGSSSCSSPSRPWWASRPACRRSARRRSPPRSARSSRAPPTSCGWGPSAARTSASAARTPASRSARTAPRRWRVEDLSFFRRSTGARCCTPPTATPP